MLETILKYEPKSQELSHRAMPKIIMCSTITISVGYNLLFYLNFIVCVILISHMWEILDDIIWLFKCKKYIISDKFSIFLLNFPIINYRSLIIDH